MGLNFFSKSEDDEFKKRDKEIEKQLEQVKDVERAIRGVKGLNEKLNKATKSQEILEILEEAVNNKSLMIPENLKERFEHMIKTIKDNALLFDALNFNQGNSQPNNIAPAGTISPPPSLQSMPVEPNNIVPLQKDEEKTKAIPKYALFYGFNGLLANKYSVIEGKTREEIHARMSMLEAGQKKNGIVWTIHEWEEFKKTIETFSKTPYPLVEIDWEEAINIIKVGQVNQFDAFIEAEVDDFDDNCTDECKPGKHNCGK